MIIGTRAISITAILALLLSQLVYSYAVDLNERAAVPARRQVAGSTTTIPSTATTPTISTTTTSITSTISSTTAVGPTQCSAANNYNYAWEGNAFDFESVVIFPTTETTVKAQGDCCRLCFAIENCFGFSEVYGGEDPPIWFCELDTLQPYTGVNTSSSCPLGVNVIPNFVADLIDTGGAPPPLSGSGPGPCFANASTTPPIGPTEICAVANNFGFTYGSGAFDDIPIQAVIPETHNASSGVLGTCCLSCFAQPNCFGFKQGVEESNAGICELYILNDPDLAALEIGLQNPTAECPAGALNITTYGGEFGFEPNAYINGFGIFAEGQGPCGIFPPVSGAGLV